MGKRLWLSIAAIIIAVAAGIYYYRSDVAAETPTLSTAEVTQGDVVATVEATGTLEAVTTVEVGSQVSGTIKTLGADFNSQVRQGQVIAQQVATNSFLVLADVNGDHNADFSLNVYTSPGFGNFAAFDFIL